MDGFPDPPSFCYDEKPKTISYNEVRKLTEPKLRRNKFNRKHTPKPKPEETQGRRIRCLRKAHNLTPKELSKRTAIPLADIIRIESDRQNLTTLHTAVFSEIFKVDPDWLLWGDSKRKRCTTEPPDLPYHQQAENLLNHLQGDTKRMKKVLDFIYFQLRSQMVKYPPVP